MESWHFLPGPVNLRSNLGILRHSVCVGAHCGEPYGLEETITMPQEAREIEVEVLEIDGVAPLVPQARASEEAPPPAGEWQDWRHWQGRVRKLDSRWWPLWVFLGIIAVTLALTVGVVFGVLILLFRFVLKIIRALLA